MNSNKSSSQAQDGYPVNYLTDSNLSISNNHTPHRPESLADILQKTTGSLGIDNKLAECRVQIAWCEIVGPILAAQTSVKRVNNRRLEVSVPSAVWRNQLSFMKGSIIEKLNKVAGAVVIEDLVLHNRN